MVSWLPRKRRARQRRQRWPLLGELLERRSMFDVGGADDVPGAFVEALPIALSASGTSATFELELAGCIETGGDLDTFRLVSPFSGRLIIAQSASFGSSLDSLVRVYSASQAQIASDDDSGGSLNSLTQIAVVEGETYFVQAGAYGFSVGNYNLSLHQDATSADQAGDSDSIVELTLPGAGALSLEGRIDVAGDRDAFHLHPAQNTLLSIAQRATPEPGGPSLDSYLSVYGSEYASSDSLLRQGALLQSNDDSADAAGNYSLDSQLEIVLSAGSDYYIEAGAFGSSTGRYTLDLQTSSLASLDNSDSFDTAVDVSLSRYGFGKRHGDIDPQGDVDYFRFTATQTTHLAIVVSSNATSSLPAISPAVAIFDAGQSLLMQSDPQGGTTVRQEMDVVAGATYYVRVNAASLFSPRGGFDLYVASLSPATDDITDVPQPIAMGANLRSLAIGSLETTADADAFRLVSPATGRVEARLLPYLQSSLYLSGELTIRASDGTVLAAGASRLAFQAVAGEPYLVEVRGGGKIGDYALAIDASHATDDYGDTLETAFALPSGAAGSIGGRFEQDVDVDVFAIAAPFDGQLRASLSDVGDLSVQTAAGDFLASEGGVYPVHAGEQYFLVARAWSESPYVLAWQFRQTITIAEAPRPGQFPGTFDLSAGATAADEAGNSLVAYAETASDAGQRDVFLAWQGPHAALPRRIPVASTEADETDAQVAIAPDGRVAVAFTRLFAPGDRDVYVALFDAQGEWLAEFAVAAGPADEFAPALAFAAGGALIAAWTECAADGLGDTDVRAASFDSAGELVAAWNVAEGPAAAGDSVVAANASGLVAIAWTEHADGFASLQARRYDLAGNRWEEEAATFAAFVSDVSRPSAVLAADGRLTLAWIQTDFGSEVWSGSWGLADIEPVTTFLDFGVSGATVRALANRNDDALLVWQQGQALTYRTVNADGQLRAYDRPLTELGLGSSDVIAGLALTPGGDLLVWSRSEGSPGLADLVLHTIPGVLSVDDYGMPWDQTDVTVSADGRLEVSGVLERAGDEDWFRFVAPVSGQVSLQATAQSDAGLPGREVWAFLYDSVDWVPWDRLQVTAGETYSIRVYGQDYFGSLQGAYHVSLRVNAGDDDFGNDLATAQPWYLTAAQAGELQGRLESADDVDVFTLRPSQDGVMVFYAYAGFDSFDMSPALTVVGPEGAAIEGSRVPGSFPDIEYVLVRVAAGETYEVRVRNGGAEGGDYRLTAQLTTEPQVVLRDRPSGRASLLATGTSLASTGQGTASVYSTFAAAGRQSWLLIRDDLDPATTVRVGQLFGDAADVGDAVVTVTPAGSIVVVYSLETEFGDRDLYADRFDSRGNWLSTAAVATTRADESQPDLALLGNDDVAIAWTADEAGNANIYVARLLGDGSLAWVQPVATGAEDESEPALAAGAEGQLAVVWADAAGGDDTDIWMTYLTAEGTLLGPPVPVSTSPSPTHRPDLALQGDRILVVWEEGLGSPELDAAVFQWGSSALQSNLDLGSAAGDAAPQAIATLDNGWIVAWKSETGEGSALRVASLSYDPGGSWLNQSELAAIQTPSPAGGVALARGPDGGPLLEWNEFRADATLLRLAALGGGLSQPGTPPAAEEPDYEGNTRDSATRLALVPWAGRYQAGYSGTQSNSADTDYFVFDAPASGTLVVSTSGMAGHLSMFGPGGELLVSQDALPLRVSVSHGERYWVQIDGAAEYHLVLELIPFTGEQLSVLTLGAHTPGDAVVSPDYLVATLFGPDSGVSIVPGSVRYQGADRAAGVFVAPSGLLDAFSTADASPWRHGIALSSGSVANLVRGNYAEQTSAAFNGPGSDSLQQFLPEGNITHDAASLAFDFVPVTNVIRFNFVFSSEEYLEYVETGYSDAFAFIVNGVNYARLADTGTYVSGTGAVVSIDNVSHRRNSALFIDNTSTAGLGSLLPVEADGLTFVLTFEAPVNAGEVNSIELVIADVSGPAFPDFTGDSWVLVQGASFEAFRETLTPATQTLVAGRALDVFGNLIDRAVADPTLTTDAAQHGYIHQVLLDELLKDIDLLGDFLVVPVDPIDWTLTTGDGQIVHQNGQLQGLPANAFFAERGGLSFLVLPNFNPQSLRVELAGMGSGEFRWAASFVHHDGDVASYLLQGSVAANQRLATVLDFRDLKPGFQEFRHFQASASAYGPNLGQSLASQPPGAGGTTPGGTTDPRNAQIIYPSTVAASWFQRTVDVTALAGGVGTALSGASPVLIVLANPWSTAWSGLFGTWLASLSTPTTPDPTPREALPALADFLRSFRTLEAEAREAWSAATGLVAGRPWMATWLDRGGPWLETVGRLVLPAFPAVSLPWRIDLRRWFNEVAGDELLLPAAFEDPSDIAGVDAWAARLEDAHPERPGDAAAWAEADRPAADDGPGSETHDGQDAHLRAAADSRCEETSATVGAALFPAATVLAGEFLPAEAAEDERPNARKRLAR